MLKNKRSNKLAVPVILVEKGDKAYPTGNLVTSTTALNLTDGQIGLLSWDFDSATRSLGKWLQAGDTATAVKAVKVVAGTPVSAATQLTDPWEAGHKAYIDSGVIRPNAIRSVSVKKAAYAQLGAEVFTGFPTPADDTEYGAFVRLLSVRNDRTFSDNDEIIQASVPATDFTTLGTVDPKDFVLQNLAKKLNAYSKLNTLTNSGIQKGNRNLVVLGVNTTGAAGTVIGNVTLGTVIPVQTDNGIVTNLVADYPLLQTLARLVQDSVLVNASTIELIDITTAGAAAKVDAIIVVGLQEKLSVNFDDIEQTTVIPELHLTDGFQTTASKPTRVKCAAKEGTGQGRKWKIESANRYLTTVHTMQTWPHGEPFATGNDYIDDTKLYASYQIDFIDNETTLTTEEISPKTVTILFPSEKASAFTATVANIVTRIAAGNSPINIVPSTDAGTGTTSVNYLPNTEAILTAWLESARVLFGYDVKGDAVAGGTYLS